MATLIIDYDGTIHDSIVIYEPAVRACYDLFTAEGLMHERIISSEEIYMYIGLTARQMWDIFAPELNDEQKKRGSEVIRQELHRLTAGGKARLYDGIPEMLQTLKDQGHKLVYLSACHISYMNVHNEYFHLDKYFDEMYCSEEFDWIPKNEIVVKLMEKWQQDPENNMGIAAIGDRFTDMEISKASDRIKTIWCSYGFGKADEGKDADETVSSPDQIPETVRRLFTCNS